MYAALGGALSEKRERTHVLSFLTNVCPMRCQRRPSAVSLSYIQRERDSERSIRSGAFMTETKCGIEAILRREKEREREREREKVFDMHSSDASVRLSR